MMKMADRAVERENRSKEPEKKAGKEAGRESGQADRKGAGKETGKEGGREAKGAGKVQEGERAKDAGKSAKAKPERDATGGDWKVKFKENINTLKDADLAARALKSDAGLAAGFFKKELSAKDRESMTRVYNSKSHLFMNDVYAAEDAKKALGEKDKEAAAKQHEAESAAMKSIVEKYGSPDQQRAYNNLDKADKDAFNTNTVQIECNQR